MPGSTDSDEALDRVIAEADQLLASLGNVDLEPSEDPEKLCEEVAEFIRTWEIRPGAETGPINPYGDIGFRTRSTNSPPESIAARKPICQPLPSSHPRADEYHTIVPILHEWLTGLGVSSYAFTAIDYHGEPTVAVFTPSQPHSPVPPTWNMPVVFFSAQIATFWTQNDDEELQNYDLDPYNPFREDQPLPGSSFGSGGADGSIGMYLTDNSGKIHILTAGHVVEDKHGYTINKKAKLSPTSTDLPKANVEIMAEVFKREAKVRRMTTLFKLSRRESKDNAAQKACLGSENDILNVWERRKKQMLGEVKLATGYRAELTAVNDEGSARGVDWSIAEVTTKERVATNTINLLGTLKNWGEGIKDPCEDMKVVKVGRSTGLTFGIVAGIKLQVNLETNNTRTEEWYIVPIKSERFAEDLPGISKKLHDGRLIVTDYFAAIGDSGSVILEYPSLIPVGLLIGGVPTRKPFPVTYFTPIRLLLGRIKSRIPSFSNEIDRLLSD